MNIKFVIRSILYVLVIASVNFLILFVISILIQQSVVHISTSTYMVIVSNILSTSIIAYIIKSKYNDNSAIIAPVLLYLVSVVSISLLKNGFVGREHLYIKQLLSPLCGVVLGIFFGTRKYYRLRNSNKKRRMTTK